VSAFKRNLVPLLCIAFVAAAASTGIFYRLLGSRLRDASSTVPRQSLVVASHNLERGTVVKAEDLKVSTWSGAEPFTGGYTLISQVIGKTVYAAVVENEPITQTRLASPDSSEGLAIAAGMRAVSVRASDSSGVLRLLRPGYKVDVQVVGPLHGTELMLRTTLQNLEVLAIDLPDPSGGRPGAPVVTLLATPSAADQLGLADSAARVRLLLRNPLDPSGGARPLLSMAGVFADTPDWPAYDRPLHGLASTNARPAGMGERAAAPAERIQLLVQVAAAPPEVLDELAAKWHWPARSEALQAVSLPPGREAGEIFRGLEKSRRIEVVWSARLRTASNRSVSMDAGASWPAGKRGPLNLRAAAKDGACGLHLRFRPRLDETGTLRIRVQPKITVSRSAGVASRKMDTEIEVVDGQSFVVSGLTTAADWPVLARFLSGRPRESGNLELLVWVTPQVMEPVHTMAAAGR